MKNRARKALIRLSFVLVAGALAGAVAAQEPSPTPERLFQDELDLQASLNVVQGSGARALGMGGAFLARADDATAASWNPAGLSYLRLPEVSFVWLQNNLNTQARDAANSLAKRDERTGNAPDFLAFAFPYNLGRASGSAQVSYQRVISFTSDRTITDLDGTRTVNSSGGFDVLALGTGLRLSRTLRAGFTVNHWRNGYRQLVQQNDRIASRENSDFQLSAWNLQLGLMVSPRDSLNLGATLKTGFTSDVTLLRSRVDSFPGFGDTTNAHSRADVSLSLPRALGVGASWRPRNNLTISADYTRSFWSNGQIRNFFTLRRDPPPDNPPPDPPEETGDFYPRLPYPTLNDPRQQDTNQLRVGIEYVILRNKVKWPVRAGYFTDEQFFRAEGGNAPTFDGVTLGAGVIVSRLLFDVAYVYETGDYVSLRDNLHTSVKSHRVYASLIYRHPR